MSTNKDEERIRVVKFDGSDDDSWREWNSKTKAIGEIQGWDQILYKDPDPSIDMKSPSNYAEKLVVKNENNAKMYLTLSCMGNAFEYVIGKSTSYDMYVALEERYEPEEIDDYLELSDKFIKCGLEDESEDPEKWFHKLEHLRVRIKILTKIMKTRS